jgi:hypothetical protein
MTPPISFTDEQLKMLVQAARPLHPYDCSTFGGRRGTAGRIIRDRKRQHSAGGDT